MSASLIKEYVKLILNEKIHNISKLKFNLLNFELIQNTKERLKYADKYLKIIGQGSARKVYILSGTKVLKIALNDAGLAQNEQEFIVYSDPTSKGIVAKIFDHADDFSWLISELTRPLKDSKEFEEMLGLKLNPNFEDTLLHIPEIFIITIGQNDFDAIENYYKNNNKVIKFAHDLKQFIDKQNLVINDLRYFYQWGKSPDNRLVLIDYGFSEDVADQHYR